MMTINTNQGQVPNWPLLSNLEKIGVLKYLKNGWDRAGACGFATVGLWRFDRQLDVDPEFAEAVAQAEQEGATEAAARAALEDGFLAVAKAAIRPAEQAAPAARRRGRRKKNFPQSERGEFLRLLHSGLGRVIACRKLNLEYKRFLSILRSDAEFAEQVWMAESARKDSCEYALFRIVEETGDDSLRLRAAVAYLGRRERVENARRTRLEKAEARAKAAGAASDHAPAPEEARRAATPPTRPNRAATNHAEKPKPAPNEPATGPTRTRSAPRSVPGATAVPAASRSVRKKAHDAENPVGRARQSDPQNQGRPGDPGP